MQAREDPFADFRRVGSGPTGNKSEPVSRPGTRGSARVGSKSAAAKHAKHGDASHGDEGEEDVRGGSSDENDSQDGSASGSEGSLGASDDSKGGAARRGKASKPSPKRTTRRAVMDSEDGTDGDDDSEDAPVKAKAPKASSKKVAAGPDNGHISVSSNEEEEEEAGLAEQDQDISMDPGSADEERAPKQAAAVAASGRTRPVRECRQPKADTSTPAQGKLAGGSKSKKAQALEDLVEEEEESSDEEDGTHVFGPIKTVLSFDGKTNLYTIKYDGKSSACSSLLRYKSALSRSAPVQQGCEP